MSDLLTRLAACFDQLGRSYRLDLDEGVVVTTVVGARRATDLGVYPHSERAIAVETAGLAVVAPEAASGLAEFAAGLSRAMLLYNSGSGEVRVRLLVPLDGPETTAARLEAALGEVIAIADEVRGRLTLAASEPAAEHTPRAGPAEPGVPPGAVGSSDREAVDEALRLLNRIIRSGDERAFVAANLDLFTEPVRAAYSDMLDRATGGLARGLYRLLEALHRARRRREISLLPADVQAVLGDALEHRADPASAERQQALLQRLLATLDHQTAPALWADLLRSLGASLQTLAARTGRFDLSREAEEAYQLALLALGRRTAPGQWARTQYLLGKLFAQRYEWSCDEADSRAAEQHFCSALEVWTRAATPYDWARSHFALGSLRQQRYEHHGREEDGRAAEAEYRLAHEVFGRDTAPADWALTHDALGRLFAHRSKRTRRVADRDAARTHFLQALGVLQRETAPAEFARVERALAALDGSRSNGAQRPVRREDDLPSVPSRPSARP